jgi:hypothetical protein
MMLRENPPFALPGGSSLVRAERGQRPHLVRPQRHGQARPGEGPVRSAVPGPRRMPGLLRSGVPGGYG